MAARFYAYDEADFYRIADALGGRTLNVIQLSDERIPETQMVDLLGSLCERAEGHGLAVSVEFLPWSPIRNLDQTLELVKTIGKSSCGVNIDTWHHFRSGGTVEQLAAVDPTLVAAVQFNDVAAEPWESVLEETALGRLLPGEGSSDSVAVLKALYGAGVRVPINVEVFSRDLIQLPAEEAARRMADSMRAVLAKAIQ
jgi:sugar phosphate isomerase/epimerase